MRELLKEYDPVYYISQLLLIAVFCNPNEVAAFKFRIMVENAWQTDTVLGGVEIVQLDTGKSKHGEIKFSTEAVKMCAAVIAQHYLVKANSDENNYLKSSETPDKTMDFSEIICDDDVRQKSDCKIPR